MYLKVLYFHGLKPRTMLSKNVDKMLVAENMRLIRNLAGMTMDAFARKVGVNKDNINIYERGRALPQKSTVIRVCEFAGISENDLLYTNLNKETLVKDMMTVLRKNLDAVGENQTLTDLRDTIKAMQATINAQAETIRLLKEMLGSFSALKKAE